MNMWNEIIISYNTMIFCSMMSQNNSQLHQQPHMNATRLNTTADTTVSMQDDSDEMQEVIEVQILPQVGSHLFLNRYIQKVTNNYQSVKIFKSVFDHQPHGRVFIPYWQ